MSEPVVSLYSERIPAVGAIGGEGAVKAVGNPALSFWEVFLRETLQNSWDARVERSIRFSIHGIRLSIDNLQVLRDVVFAELPPSADSAPAADSPAPDARTLLEEFVRSERSSALLVQDVRTRGLGGPARADLVVDKSTATDFRNFVFEIGKNTKEAGSGGTYGFGKGVLYAASRLRTCLIYTCTVTEGELSHRFIATRVGPDFQSDGRRFTGRHWWGDVESDSVLPMEGAPARSLAGLLGMQIPEGLTGTSIMVLDPRDPRDPAESALERVLEEIRGAALKWAWPHLVGEDGEPTIDFDLRVEGAPLRVALEDSPTIEHFAAAYREAIKFTKDEPVSYSVRAESLLLDPGRARTGVLAVRKTLSHEGLAEDLDRHVALMRAPRFVVKYERIEKDPLGQFTAGVFIANADVDERFANAEPVTHDEWRREPGGAASRPVAWTLDDIKKATRVEPSSLTPEQAQPVSTGVARVAQILGKELIGVTGSGAEILPRVRGGGGSGPRRPVTVRIAGDARPMRLVANRVEAEFPVSVTTTPSADLEIVSVRADPRIVTEAGGVDRGRDVAQRAEIVAWLVDGEVHQGASVVASQLRGENVRVLVSHDHDIAVALSITVEGAR